MIYLENISKEYESFNALTDITLQIDDNQIYGIAGFSGAGKSTLLRIINGLILPSSGKVIIDDVDLLTLKRKALNRMRHNIGIIFQNFNLLSSLTVYENVILSLQIAKYPRDLQKDRTLDVIKLVGLSDKINSYPSQLSGGQKQRVAIARAIANNPKYLLCDEITSALDYNTSLEIVSLIKTIQNEFNLTVIFVSHDMEMLRRLCTKVIIMAEGKIVELGNTKSVFINPKSEVTKKLIPYSTRVYDEENIYQLIYTNELIKETIITDLILKKGCVISILSAETIDLIDDQIGFLTVKIFSKNIESVLTYLTDKGITVKSLSEAKNK